MFVSAPIAIPQVDAGKVRLIAVATQKRSSLLPNSPTFTEAGLAKFEASSMVGLMGPAGMAPDVVAKVFRDAGVGLRLWMAPGGDMMPARPDKQPKLHFSCGHCP